jgi:uncharacterized protein
MLNILLKIAFIILLSGCSTGQKQTPKPKEISGFISIEPGKQTSDFRLPQTHEFLVLLQRGDTLADGNTLPEDFDFTGYFPLKGSQKGLLLLNHENRKGDVSVHDLELKNGIWKTGNGSMIDFSIVNGTTDNCSGTFTPWGTYITCEEDTMGDSNDDGYYDFGWAIEIDPVKRQVIDQPGGLAGADKLWALGNFKHENAVVHPNQRTVYQGADMPFGFLYKFVAEKAGDLSKGKLYVYKGSKSGNGKWIQIKNNTPTEQNTTYEQSVALQATPFHGIEDVEVSPIDHKIYFTVKDENEIYRFTDPDPLKGLEVENMETYAGDMAYAIQTKNGTATEDWGRGHDNLAFDNLGNLWVLQDGNRNYIWVIDQGHTQQNPKIRIFGQAPFGAEPTGITFTPDFKYLFMSIQHPSKKNAKTTQTDKTGRKISFDKDAAIVISVKGDE